jgi:hypothetical protein
MEASMQTIEQSVGPSVHAQVSDAEWEQRVNLAACYRMVAMYGWDDLIFTHISARVPGPEHHFLINPYGMLFEEITASSLVKIDLDGNKVMRLHGQTAKIEGGIVLFPKEAHWLDTYLLELVTFPNAKNDDQGDSTVFALAWSTLQPTPGIIEFYKQKAAMVRGSTDQTKMFRVRVPPGPTHWYLITGSPVAIPPDRIIEV